MEFEYITGPRYLEDGRNLDSDVSAVHPVVTRREINQPVSDGSLGEPGYEPGQFNKDNLPL